MAHDEGRPEQRKIDIDGMNLKAINKPVFDTLNRPLRDLRISVIDRCNFRCSYCMPKDSEDHYKFLPSEKWLSFPNIVRLAKAFVHLGVSKLRLTGGEPLLRPGLTELVRELAAIPGVEDLSLTTNGSLLSQYARPLKDAGLNRLTVSLDTLDSRVFRSMTGQKGTVKTILDGIKEAETCGFSQIKINIVIQKGVNDRTILDLVRHFRGSGHVLRFIEYMDVGNCNHWEERYVVPSEEVIKIIQKVWPLAQLEANYFGEVAERYRFLDGKGEVGFISSVSRPFCHSCTRLRLSVDGKLYTCLFASKGIDLRQALNNPDDDHLLSLLRLVWEKRSDQYSQQRWEILKSDPPQNKIEMYQIGG